MEIIKCKYCEETSESTKMYGDICRKHYIQISRYGKIYKRTIYDPNEIIIYNDYAEIVLYDKKCNEKGRTKIDIEDVEKCKDIKWGLINKGTYVHSKIGLLHRFIKSENGNDTHIDHINHDTLDNRKENLRIVTPSQNAMNHKLHKHNTSGYNGVWFRKERKTWVAEIILNSKKINLGNYKNIEDAILARKNADIKYFGEYMYNK